MAGAPDDASAGVIKVSPIVQLDDCAWIRLVVLTALCTAGGGGASGGAGEAGGPGRGFKGGAGGSENRGEKWHGNSFQFHWLVDCCITLHLKEY